MSMGREIYNSHQMMSTKDDHYMALAILKRLELAGRLRMNGQRR